jgi:hypothetical protein
MLKTWSHPAVIGLSVLLGIAGCADDPLAGRQALDLEQALHGHWSSTRNLELPNNAAAWDITDATEKWHAEIDRYIDAQTEPKGWSEMAGDRTWRTRSQDAAAGVIELETWPVGRPGKSTAVELWLDTDRKTMLEKLPSKKSRVTLREWTYVNADAQP